MIESSKFAQEYFVIFLSILIVVIGVLLFSNNTFFPIWFSSLIYIATTLYLILCFFQSKIGIIFLAFWAFFILPFIHILPYNWFDFSKDFPFIMWGLVANDYMRDQQIIELVGMIGAIASIGFLFSSSLTTKRLSISGPYTSKNKLRSMNIFTWSLWLFAGFIAAYLTAPSSDIFTGSYSEGISTASDNSGLDSLLLMGHLVLIFCFADLMFDQRLNRRKLKLLLFLLTTIYIVFFLQFLRGNREIIPLIFAFFVSYYYFGSRLKDLMIQMPSSSKIVISIVFLFFVSFLIGIYRSQVAGVSSISELLFVASEVSSYASDGSEGTIFNIDNLIAGTWSSSLLTVLSVSGDYVIVIEDGSYKFRYGQDYLNLFLSMPPGFIADIIGYDRPNDLVNPASQMIYGLGGIHLSVYPFINFGITGVFLIIAGICFFVQRVERSISRNMNFLKFAIITSAIYIMPGWIWYTEKELYNLIIYFFIFFILYNLSIEFSKFFSSKIL